MLIDPIEEYRLIGIYSFGKGILHREPKRGSELGDYRFFRVLPGDLVLSNIQAWEGAIAHATAADLGTVGTHRFLAYTAVDDRVDTNWARWFFLSEPGMSLIRSAAPGTTMRNRTLSIERFEDLVIPLPSIGEQRRVAAALDRFTELTVDLWRLRRRGADLRGGLASALVLRSSSISKIARFGDLFRLVRRQVHVDPSATYRELGIRSFGRGIFHKEPVSGADLGNKRMFQVEPGDLVISNVFAWEGAVAVAGESEAGLTGSHRFMTWVPRSGAITADWTARYLTSANGIDALRRASPGSAGRNRTLAIARLETVAIAVPTIEQQREIARILRQIEDVDAVAFHANDVGGVLSAAMLNRVFGATALV